MRHVSRGNRAVGADIGPVVRPGIAPEAENAAVRSRCDLDVAFDLSGVIGTQQMLAPVFDPFDGPVESTRRERNEKILGVEFAAGAEAATHIQFDHLDLSFGQPHGLRQGFTVRERDLGCAPHRELFRARIPFRDEPARLHEQRGMTLYPERLPAHVVRGPESGLDISAHGGPTDRDVRTVRRRLGRLRIHSAGNRRQQFNVDLDQLKRVLRNRRGLRNDNGHRFSHKPHLPVCQHGLAERLEFGERLKPQRNARHVRSQITRRDDGPHTWQVQRIRSVDPSYAAVRDRTAQNHGMELTLPVDVGNVLSTTAQKPRVLHALDRAADKPVCRLHEFTSSSP